MNPYLEKYHILKKLVNPDPARLILYHIFNNTKFVQNKFIIKYHGTMPQTLFSYIKYYELVGYHYKFIPTVNYQRISKIGYISATYIFAYKRLYWENKLKNISSCPSGFIQMFSYYYTYMNAKLKWLMFKAINYFFN